MREEEQDTEQVTGKTTSFDKTLGNKEAKGITKNKCFARYIVQTRYWKTKNSSRKLLF